MANDESRKQQRLEAPAEDDACVHIHPIPPTEVGRYSVVRDPDAENDIANYIHGQAPDETVQHVEKVKTEYVMGDAFEIWDVTTDKERWWVITNLTNLYSQKHFPSLDYTLSFHIGLMMRLRSRDSGDGDPDPFDEVMRRHDQALKNQERAVEAEDHQAVGMQLRECLVTLIGAVRRRVELPDVPDRPKNADFVGWSSLLLSHLCPGERNKQLRQYLKVTSEKTWQLVNWLTHDRSANAAASSIAAHSCQMIIGHFIQIVVRNRTDNTDQCPQCKSRNVRSHYDIEIEPVGDYYNTCGECGWSSHPDAKA